MNIKLSLDLHEYFLHQKMDETAQKIAFLAEDLRQDEANLLKAKRNVFDIFCKMLQLSRKKGEAAGQAYSGYLQDIPKNWVNSRALALQFEDAHRQAVEDIKLSALQEILAHWTNLSMEGGTARA